MSFVLSDRSLKRLAGVKPELIQVVTRAIQITSVDFAVTEGVRTLNRQKELVASGASLTMDSRHLTGHAVDLAAMVGGQVRWDWPLYDALAAAMKNAALECGVSIVWGGDWTTFKDGPHFELDRKRYPA